jgi:hypothetical protein
MNVTGDLCIRTHAQHGRGSLMINTAPFEIQNLTYNKIVQCYNENPSFTRGLDIKITEECGWLPMYEHLGYGGVLMETERRIFK